MNAESTMDSSISSLCARTMTALARQAGLQATDDDDSVRIGDTIVNFVAEIESEKVVEGQHLVGLAVRAQQKGANTTFVAGSVGIGADRKEAIQTAVDEWAQMAGLALLRALVLKGHADLSVSAGHFDVYPGATGVRGSQELPWNDSEQKRLVALIAPALQSLSAEGHSLYLVITVDESGAIKGQALLDGKDDALILGLAKTFPWPQPRKAYMFKQYYVIAPPS